MTWAWGCVAVQAVIFRHVHPPRRLTVRVRGGVVQVHRVFRKPLVVFEPKSLLRHPRAVSSLAEMAPGTRFLVRRTPFLHPSPLARGPHPAGPIMHGGGSASSQRPTRRCSTARPTTRSAA